MSNSIRLNKGRQIDLRRCDVRYVQSSGPGGQHVNKVATKVQLSLPTAELESMLSDQEMARLLEKLGNSISQSGHIMVSCSDTRSQKRNLDIACKRMGQLIRNALIVPKRRKATRPTRASIKRRLKQKKQHSEKKQARRQKWEP
jgi:ribosome-associated protein